jgi:hypothetical protein
MVRYKETGPPIVDTNEVETAPLWKSHNISVQQYNGNPGGFQGGNDGLVDPVLVFCQFQWGEKDSRHCLSDVTIANLFYQFRVRFASFITKVAPEKGMVLFLGQASQLATNRLKNFSAAKPRYQ